MTADSRRGPRLQKGLTVLRRVAPALAVILTTAGAIFVVSRSGPAEPSSFAARVVDADTGVGVTVPALNFERLAESAVAVVTGNSCRYDRRNPADLGPADHLGRSDHLEPSPGPGESGLVPDVNRG